MKWVFFDLGGTLWHSAPPTPETVAARVVPRVASALREAGIDHPNPEFFVHTLLDRIREANAEASARDHATPDLPYLVTCHVREWLGNDIARDGTLAILRALPLEGGTLPRRLYPDALPALEAVATRGLRIGCITNRFFAGEPLRHDLRLLGLAPYLEVVAASCEVGYLKPHPAIFNCALARAGCSASDAVMVGDSLHADFEGAMLAGLRAIWLRREQATPADRPPTSVPSIRTLADLPALLETL